MTEVLNPFVSALGLIDCAITLRANINYERSHYESASAELSKIDPSANDYSYYLTEAWKNNAECHKYTLRVLELLAENLANNLSPEAREEVKRTFDFLNSMDAKKAG